MRSIHEFVLRVVRDAIRNETMTNGGRVNLVAMILLFDIIVAAGAMDAIQAVVRIARPDYTAGGAPLLPLVSVFACLTIVCVVSLNLVDPLGRKSAGGGVDD